MNTFKILFLFGLIISTTNYAFGQSKKINIDYSKSSTLMVNKIKLKKNFTIKKLKEIAGEPSKTVNYPNELSYFYEDMGIVFFSKKGKIKGVGINFNWDKDERFPEKTFTGVLNIGETEITIKTKNEEVEQIESVGFICPTPIMCASNDKKSKVNCLVAFEEEKITQVVFILN